MGKRIVLRPARPQERPAQKAVEQPWETGKERRVEPRRSGLPRRILPDRRRSSSAIPPRPEQRAAIRRRLADRRRRPDRRFGLDPTLYDRLVDLDL